jgi:hypothetical protein
MNDYISTITEDVLDLYEVEESLEKTVDYIRERKEEIE